MILDERYIKHQQNSPMYIVVLQNKLKNCLTEWLTHLFGIITICFYIFFFNIAYAENIDNYAFLAVKYKNETEIKAAPRIINYDLLNLPEGEYYLHMIISIPEDNTWKSISYKFNVLIDQELGGIKVDEVQSLTKNQTNKNSAKKKLNQYIPNNKNKTLPNFLRGMVEDSTFINLSESIVIQKVHRLDVGNLTHHTLQNLWQIWDPTLNGYDSDESIAVNLETLEISMSDAGASFGFIYSNNTDSEVTEEQQEFKNYYQSFVGNLEKNFSLKEEKYIKKRDDTKKLLVSLKENLSHAKNYIEDYKKETSGNLKTSSEMNKKWESTNKQYDESLNIANRALDQKKIGKFELANELLDQADEIVDRALNQVKEIINPQPSSDINRNRETVDEGGGGGSSSDIILIVMVILLLMYVLYFLKPDLQIFKLFNKTPSNIQKKPVHSVLQEKTDLDSALEERLIIITEDIRDEFSKKINELELQYKSYPISSERLATVIEEKDVLKLASDPIFVGKIFETPVAKAILFNLMNEFLKEGRARNAAIVKKTLAKNHLQNVSQEKQSLAKQPSLPLTDKTIDSSHSIGLPTNVALFKQALEGSTIIRQHEMRREFEAVIGNDLLLAKSISGWMKPSLAPNLYQEVDSALEKYKEGRIRLYSPEIGTLFSPEQHDLTVSREKQMHGKGAKVSKIIRPGVKMKVNNQTTIISRVQVEIRT